MRHLALALLVFSGLACADARQVDEYAWEGVERIIAVGDLHGDFENYLGTLRAAGIVDKKGKWSGGATHLVQTGDIPDRGPDTGKIIAHMSALAKQAQRKGGRVHNLIGNHEAMNVYGDLRYVHEGEYQAFVTRRSADFRDRYFEVYMKNLETQNPNEFAALPEDFRGRWNAKHPLGWVEHRQAWDPAWNPDGEYATWVLDNKVAIRVNDNIFVHGGISGFYCRNSLASLTEKVTDGLRNFDPQNPGILEDEYGPLWYRGLSGVEPTAPPETVDAILAQHGVKRIVVGHTPTSGVVWPRYNGKVVMIDTGIAQVYGGYRGYLEINPDGVFGGYRDGKLPLPGADDELAAYLAKVIELNPQNPHLKKRLQQLLQPPEPEPAPTGQVAGSDVTSGVPSESAEADQRALAEMPICGIVE